MAGERPRSASASSRFCCTFPPAASSAAAGVRDRPGPARRRAAAAGEEHLLDTCEAIAAATASLTTPLATAEASVARTSTIASDDTEAVFRVGVGDGDLVVLDRPVGVGAVHLADAPHTERVKLGGPEAPMLAAP